MNSLATNQTLQLISYSIGLIQMILGLYIFALNIRHTANRHAAFLFLLFAVNGFATAWMIGTDTIVAANQPAAVLAATTPVFGPALLLTATVLVKPEWLSGRFSLIRLVLYLLVSLPIIISITDIVFNTNIWFVGIDPANYTPGFQSLSEYTSESLTTARLFYLIGIPVLSLIPFTYWAFIDKDILSNNRRLARLLLVGQITTILLQVVLTRNLPQPLPSLLTNTLFFAIYAYASFSQLVSERRLQRGRIQVRLTALVLTISIPLLIFTSVFLFSQTSSQIRQDAVNRLDQISKSIAENTNTWLDLNIKALAQMNSQPGIISMIPTAQKPILASVDETYPHMYLVSTTDQDGINIARSDENLLTDYSDRAWFQEAIQGTEVAFQTLIGRTTGEPALVVSKPILSDNGDILGVGMFATDLNDLSMNVTTSQFGETGRIFIIDAQNQVVAHTIPEYANQLLNLSSHPAVAAMRSGSAADNGVRYADESGTIWVAYFQEMDHGWGVVSEQSEAEVLGTLRNLQLGTWIVIILGTILLIVLSGLAIRQSIQPIHSLTETATAIAAGDLSRMAPVESVDEFGVMANAFNQMTEQLLELIGNLEQRVADRTKDLEARSRQLEAAAEVGRSASSILDVNQLMRNTVELIRERFNLYYVGLFIVDDDHEFAVLKAGTGEAGKNMLARDHRIRIGAGMVGWTVAQGLPRVALEVGEDAVRQATAELPNTRSEAAIPLRSRGQVIGALTVQSVHPGEFDEATIAVLGTMADLVSVAIDNARLFTESENALRSMQQAYSELSQEDWMQLLQTRAKLSFRSDRSGIVQITDDAWSPQMAEAWKNNSTVIANHKQSAAPPNQLAIPIRIRGNVIGVMQTQKTSEAGGWTDEERLLLETIIEQLGIALDSARLYEETQIQANNERLIGDISSQMRQTLDIESVLKTAARELRSVLDLAEVEIRMGNAPTKNSAETAG